MTTPDEEPLTQHIEHAVAALTAAALATYPTPDGPERHDFGAIACQVLTTVAANLGGIAALLAGRPGSWEADSVRQIVHASTPEDQLLGWRTEPVRLRLNPADVLAELGVAALYEQARDQISDRYFRDCLTDDQVDAIDKQVDALDALWEADLAAYTTAYPDLVRAAAAELGITVPVEVDVINDDRGDPEWWDTLAERLHATARAATPLPTSGLAPRDYPTDRGRPGEVDRVAGRTYLARLAEQGGAS